MKRLLGLIPILFAVFGLAFSWGTLLCGIPVVQALMDSLRITVFFFIAFMFLLLICIGFELMERR